MNLIIQQFVKNIKDWRTNFKIEEFDENIHKGESAQFFSYLKTDKDKAVKYALSLYNKALNLGYFEITHPLYENVKVRAVKTYLDNTMGWKKFVHYIFMIDETKEKPLIMFQRGAFIDWIFVEDKIISYNPEPSAIHWGMVNPLCENLNGNQTLINEEFDYFSPGKLVFLIGKDRPSHFFREDPYGAFKLNEMNEKFTYMKTNDAFFVSKSFKAMPPREDYILLKSTCVYDYGVDEVFKRVYNEALEDKEKLVEMDSFKQNYELTLWLGLPGERRAWLEQVEGTAQILKNLSRYFKKIKVYVDGMTAYDGEKKEYPENKILFNKVLNATKEVFDKDARIKEFKNLNDENSSKENFTSNNLKILQESLNLTAGGGGGFKNFDLNSFVFDFDELKELASSNPQIYAQVAQHLTQKEKFIVFKSLAGYDYRTKICYASDCNLALSDSSTTALVPFEFNHLPGVVFSSEKHFHYSKYLAEKQKHLKPIDTKYSFTTQIKSWCDWNYYIPWQHIYNLAAEVLEELVKEKKITLKHQDENFDIQDFKIHRLEIPSIGAIKQIAAENDELRIKNKSLEDDNIYFGKNLRHSAVARVKNHLAYKLGTEIIICNKSLWGLISMPFILSFVKAQYKKEQKAYQALITQKPEFKFPNIETYPDYEAALKEKECLTYKLGLAMMKADKTWLSGGYIKFYFEAKRLEREFKKEKALNKE